MRVLYYSSAPYAVTNGAVGNIASATPGGPLSKLSDAQINYQPGDNVFKFVSPLTNLVAYLRTSSPYNDVATGANLISSNYQACDATSYAGCTWNTFGAGATFDTHQWGLTGNDQTRIFTDYFRAGPSCYGVASGSYRCYSSQANGHAPLAPFTIFMRPFSLSP